MSELTAADRARPRAEGTIINTIGMSEIALRHTMEDGGAAKHVIRKIAKYFDKSDEEELVDVPAN